jgi:uridine phosphorylase
MQIVPNQALAPSELILNPDGSVYHLKLQPEQLATTVITVGDPERVGAVSKHFDRIEHKVQSRELITHTGYIGTKRISVLSTGMGTDNIDICLNELDALVNIDLSTRIPKSRLTSLDIIRIGTSGCLRGEIPLDAFLVSKYAVGMEGLMLFYPQNTNLSEQKLSQQLQAHAQQKGFRFPITPTFAQADDRLSNLFAGFYEGITLTATGFYAPQNRNLRLGSAVSGLFEMAADFEFEGLHITNLEMETSGIYGLANLLGHKAVSLSALIANRVQGSFSKDSHGAVDKLIVEALTAICAG